MLRRGHGDAGHEMKAGPLRASSLLGGSRAMFLAWRFTARRLHAKPVRPRLLVLVVAWGAIWLTLRPPGQGGASYLGQLCGAESILLLSIALVLISTLPWVEVWFDGIDRAANGTRRAAITGVVLLVPHILLSKSSPTGGSGKSLGVVGALGLLVLVMWAVVPRWRSVLPRFVRPAVVAVGTSRASATRVLCSAATSDGGPSTA